MDGKNIECKITILGETGSGKTCYLLGMYSMMQTSIAGYTIYNEDEEARRTLAIRYKNLKAKQFPEITDQSQKFDFELQYAAKTILPFKWIDYPGGWLEPTVENKDPEQYEEVKQSIEQADTLFICIDGTHLVGSDINEKIQLIKENSAANINNYLGQFQGNLPPIVMIVTKYDLCEKATNNEEIKQIITTAFEQLFLRNDVSISIIPVSIGTNLQAAQIKTLQPLNIHLPILMGIKFALIKMIVFGALMEKKHLETIEALHNAKRELESTWFANWRHGQKIQEIANHIQDTTTLQKKIHQISDYFQQSLNKIEQQLSKVELIFENGDWKQPPHYNQE